MGKRKQQSGLPEDTAYQLSIRPLLDVKQVGMRLNMSRRFVLGLIYQNQLPAFKIGNRWRISQEDLISFITKFRSSNKKKE